MVPCGPVPDHLTVGLVDLGPPPGHPGCERGVHLLDGGEGPPGEHVVADDQHLAFDAAFAGGAVGGQHVDVEVVVSGESDRFGMQRHRLAGSDMPPDDGLGAVVDDRHRHPAEVRERPPVAVEEGLQILARGEAAERITGVRKGHVEGIDLPDAHMREGLALVAPVDLRLGAGDHLEPAVQARQFLRRDPEFLGDPGAGFLNVELDPLVVPGEPVLRDQAFMDDRGLHQDLGPQHRIDQRRELVDHSRPGPSVRRPLRRCFRALRRQVLPDRLAVQPRLPGDLRQAQRTGLQQPPETP